MRRGDAIPEVRDDLWPPLGVSEEEIEDVLVSPEVLADIVESAIQHFGTSYYTVKQISMRWQCSTKHVRRSIKSGALPAHSLGRILRVSADDLYRYERTCRVI